MVVLDMVWEVESYLHCKRQKNVHSEGFEPPHTNILQLECSAIDRSAMNALQAVGRSKIVKPAKEKAPINLDH